MKAEVAERIMGCSSPRPAAPQRAFSELTEREEVVPSLWRRVRATRRYSGSCT